MMCNELKVKMFSAFSFTETSDRYIASRTLALWTTVAKYVIQQLTLQPGAVTADTSSLCTCLTAGSVQGWWEREGECTRLSCHRVM